MKLHALKFGLAAGIFWGVCLFLFTWVASLSGYGTPWLQAVVVPIYPGYTVSPLGSVLGLVYGFLDGIIGCSIFAWLYNRLVG
ncbi:MAG TPA: bacteriophage holin [bacterium]|nr:bacteriophage holin [bacterium]